MLLKQSDPMVLEKKVNIKPINYAELNRLSEDFGKRFVPQHELSDEQALHPNTDQSASSSVKIEAPRELPRSFYNLVLLLIQVTTASSTSAAVSLDLSRLATTLNRQERSIHWDQQVIYSMEGEDEFHDDNPPPPPPPVTPTQQALHTLSTIILPILKKGEYDIWAMKMEHYLGHTDYPIWEIIQKENGPVQVSTDTNGQIKVLPPKTAKEILAREGERKARTTLLMAIPEDHLAKFHKITNAKEMWEAIKSRFGLHKGYDMFQSLLSQLEIHGAGVSTEDANQKLLRSLPASWSQVSLIMRTKSGVDTLSFDDLYNNLRVFESDIKGSTALSSSTQNVAFVSSESTNKGPSSYIDELKYSFFANLSSGPQLDHEDLEQGEGCSLMPRNQLALTRPRLSALIAITQGSLLEGADQKEIKKAQEEMEGVDWTGHAEDEQENFTLMAYSNSGSDTEVTSCSKDFVESYAKFKKLYDEQREQLGDASIEIQAYTQALKKKLLSEAVKEKEELKTKLENFQSSSKGLSKLLNSQMSTRDKSGLGYGNLIHEGVLSYEKEVLESVFDSRSSDVEETSESDAKTSDFDSCETNSSVETLEFVPELVVVEPKVVSQPKVWSDAPIIEEYESDNDDEYVIEPSKEQEKPSFAFVNIVKHVKTPRETVKEQNTCSPSPKVNKRDWNDSMSKRLGLGYGFTKKACFVVNSKGTGQGENRPVWNNVQRLNHQNKFVPKAVLTKTGIFSVNTARQNPFSQVAETSTTRKVNTARHNPFSQATETSTTRKLNTARPIVNEIRLRNNFYKSHSPIRRLFNKSTTPKANFTNHKVNTAGDKIVSAVRGYRKTAVKASACCN
ncbi:hypothetical protein Tco_1351639 [Tanacetum coccineum]